MKKTAAEYRWGKAASAYLMSDCDVHIKEDKELVSSLTLAADDIKVMAKYIDLLMEQCRTTEPHDYTVLKHLSKMLWIK